MKTKKIFFIFLLIVFCYYNISSQLRIIGNANPNLFSVVKTFPSGIYAIGSTTLNNIPHATFSKFTPSGHLIWTVRLSERSQFTDFESTENGFLLVGLEPSFDDKNRSLTANISEFGVINSVLLYDLSTGEEFNRVVKNPNPLNPDYTYLILGTKNKPNLTFNDYTLLANAHSSGIVSTISRVESGNLDIQLNSSIKPLSTGGFGICGDILGNGQITFIDNQLSVTNSWRPDGTKVSFINDFIEVPNVQRIVWIGKNSNNEAIIGRGDISNGAPDWTYKITSGTGITTNFHRIFEANGHYYITMSLINASSNTTSYAIGKYLDNNTNLNLVWVKNIEDGETTFTGANLVENTIINGLVFTDGRTGNSSGFGQMDGCIANTNYDLLSCATNDITSSIKLMSTSISPSQFLVNIANEPVPIPKSMLGVSLSYYENNICETTSFDIPKSLFPIDTVEYAIGDSIEFQWQALMNYNSTYKLKILQIKQGEIPPNELPETGLFFERSGIIGTNFIYNNLLPPFDTSGQFKYVWSIQTDDLVNGKLVKGGPIVWIPVPFPYPIFKPMMWITSILPKELCSDTCFTVTGQWRPLSTLWSWKFKLMSVYSSNIADVMIMPNGVSPILNTSTNDISLYNVLPFPDMINTFGFNGNFSFDVCIKPNAVGPISLKFYANLASSACNSNQTGPGCLYAVVNHTINIIQPSFNTSPTLTIQHPTNGTTINEICNGDPVKFDMPIPSNPNVSVTWEEYNQITSTWVTLTHPDFNGSNPSTFTVTSGVLTINCTSTTAGFEDKLYRARIKVLGSLITPPSTLPDSCIYYSTIFPMRICCKLSPATVSIVPNTPLCEMDTYCVTVSLNTTDAFVPNGTYVDVDWSSSDPLFPSSTYQDLLTFTYCGTAGTSNIVFTAVIKNCANKIQTVSGCIEVSKKPKCGTIKGNWHTMTQVTPQNPLASLSYNICQGDDAALEVDIPGQDCIINWEYTDDPANPNNLWIPVGSSTNSTQYTNILMPFGWLGCRYYRIRCEPLPLTGACGPIPAIHPCLPCYSNIVEICLWPPPQKPLIDGSLPICKGQSVPLSVVNPVAGETYCWLWNGKDIGTGTSIIATEPGNYWVIAKGKCEMVQSDWFELVVCCPDAKISCPLAPNQCAHTNEEICFLGIGLSNCGPIINYEWQVNGVTMQSSLSDGFCVPAGWVSPLIVTLIVTDSNGCLDSYTIQVEACE